MRALPQAHATGDLTPSDPIPQPAQELHSTAANGLELTGEGGAADGVRCSDVFGVGDNLVALRKGVRNPPRAVSVPFKSDRSHALTDHDGPPAREPHLSTEVNRAQECP